MVDDNTKVVSLLNEKHIHDNWHKQNIVYKNTLISLHYSVIAIVLVRAAELWKGCDLLKVTEGRAAVKFLHQLRVCLCTVLKIRAYLVRIHVYPMYLPPQPPINEKSINSNERNGRDSSDHSLQDRFTLSSPCLSCLSSCSL